MAKRAQKDGGLEISFTQKNKWEKVWRRYWFYVKTPGVVAKTRPRVKKYPFASTMGDMKPSTRVRHPAEVDAERWRVTRPLARPAASLGVMTLSKRWWYSIFSLWGNIGHG